MNKTVIILRGISGAGKSTWIKRFLEVYRKLYYKTYYNWESQYKICSADKYFTRPDGRYSWNAQELPEAHRWCFQEFQQAFYKHWLIFVDNTNLCHWEYEHYVKEAELAGYKVKIKTIGEFTNEAAEIYSKRNIHNVPKETILKMIRKYEK